MPAYNCNLITTTISINYRYALIYKLQTLETNITYIYVTTTKVYISQLFLL